MDANKVKEDVKAKHTAIINEEAQMEVENTRVYNKKTLRDQYGNYPVWMNHRKILKHKKGRAKTQKASTKMRETGKKLTRRQKKVMKQKQ